MKGNIKLLWTGRICIVVSMLAIVITSQLYIADYVDFAIARQIGRPLAIFVYYGAPVVFIAVFAWFYPAAGGVITVLYVLRTLPMELVARMPQILVPIPVHILVYGLLALGGLIGLIYVCVSGKPETLRNPAAEKMITYARVAVVFSIILCAIILATAGGTGFVIVAFFSLVLLAIAWFWPASGGVLMVVNAVLGFLAVSEYDFAFGRTWLAYVPLVILAISGLVHVFGAWKQGLLRYG